jgi:hypothetical protein
MDEPFPLLPSLRSGLPGRRFASDFRNAKRACRPRCLRPSCGWLTRFIVQNENCSPSLRSVAMVGPVSFSRHRRNPYTGRGLNKLIVKIEFIAVHQKTHLARWVLIAQVK